MRLTTFMGLLLAVVILGMPLCVQAQTYKAGSNYIEPGALRTVIQGSLDIVSGGEQEVESGATFTAASGSTVNLAGTTQLAGVTLGATATEIDAVADLSANGGLLKVVQMTVVAAPDGTDQLLGFQLPVKSVLLGVFIDTTVAEATGGTKTLDVGIAGDADAFLTNVTVDSVGVTTGSVNLFVGGSETFMSTTTWGDSMAHFTSGSDTATDVGTFLKVPYVVTGGAEDLVINADSGDWVEWRGSIYLTYLELE